MIQNKNTLLSMLKECTCSFTTVRYAVQMLEEQGFQMLKENESWTLEPERKYMISLSDSGLFAFVTGRHIEGRLKLVAAHTDQPAFVLKPHPEMKEKGYGRLNAEVYGGPILNTWMDRPLSVAGKVTLASDCIFEPRVEIVDLKRPLAVIPNLAIHLNHEVNKGVALNRQKDMLALCTCAGEKEWKDSFFHSYLAKSLQTEESQILDYELYLYNQEEGCYCGMEEEFISAPRLDNLSSVQACLTALCQADVESGIAAICLYDNEEIGSMTRQGADNIYVSMLLERIYEAFGITGGAYWRCLTDGFFVSLDVAHAHHPNHPEKSDPVNQPMLNEGIVIKRAAKQTYATDSTSIAIIEQLCRAEEIPYQKYAIRSDGTSGSTLGSIANKYLPMRVVDLGVPVLAMHSAREMMGRRDQEYMEKFVKCFLNIREEN